MTAPSPPVDGYPDRNIAISGAGYTALDGALGPARLAQAVLSELRRWRFRLDDEAALQEQIHGKLVAAGFAATREVRLGLGDRIDLLVGPEAGPALGVEVKIKGQRRAIWRQCARYCGYERVGALLVVTNAAMGFPAEAEGKPIFVHELGKGWLG